MLFASLILGSLIIAVPIATIFDGSIVHGVVLATTAVLLASIAVRLRPADATFVVSITRPVLMVAVIPVFWMVLQALPLNRLGLSNSIWESAASALGRPLNGSISIDPGATILSLTRYLSLVAIAFASAAVTVDRQRAEWVFFALAMAATLTAVLLSVTSMSNFGSLLNVGNTPPNNPAITALALGIILSAAGTLYNYKNAQTKSPRPTDRKSALHRPTFMPYVAALTICMAAFLLNATTQHYFAVCMGLTVLVAAFAARRFSLGPWGISAVFSLVLFVAISIIVVTYRDQTVGLTLAFAPLNYGPLVNVTQRILSDAGWAGFGAGTFAAILPIYRDINELAIGCAPPTAAAAIGIEMGLPFFWVGLVATIALVVTLLHGALKRGRDSIYSVAGASCGAVVMLQEFCDASMFSTSVSIIVAVTAGMAIVQSKSRLR